MVSSKSCKFGQIDDFSCFFAKWGTFCDFWVKSSSKRRNTVVSSKSWKFWSNLRFLVFFREIRHFLRLLAEKFVKRPKHRGCLEKLEVLAKSTIFRVSSRNETFWEFWLKSSSKRRNVVVSSKSWKFWPNRWFLVFFHEMRHFLRLLAGKFVRTPKHGGFFEKLQVLAKSMIFFFFFSRNEALFATFGWKFVKTPKHFGVFEKLQVFAKSMISSVFSRNEALFATFGWKVRWNPETGWFLRIVASFGQIDDF